MNNWENEICFMYIWLISLSTNHLKELIKVTAKINYQSKNNLIKDGYLQGFYGYFYYALRNS